MNANQPNWTGNILRYLWDGTPWGPRNKQDSTPRYAETSNADHPVSWRQLDYWRIATNTLKGHVYTKKPTQLEFDIEVKRDAEP